MRDLDLKHPAFLQDSLVVSASAGSGKTFTLTVLVLGALGRQDLRPFEILATTFSESAAADLRERLLRPLDLLVSLREGDWEGLLPHLDDPGALRAGLRALSLAGRLAKSREELCQAAPLWGAPAWAAAPGKARAFWKRVRQEAELLQVSTLHALALGLLGQGEGAPESILDAAHPALLRVLRQTLREALDLPAEHPHHLPAKALLTWAERNWADLSAGHDGHRDALGHLDPAALEASRERVLEALGAAGAALAPFAAQPALAVDPGNRFSRNFKPSSILAVPGAGAPLDERLDWARRQSLALNLKDREGCTLAGYFTPGFQAAFDTLGGVAATWEAWVAALLVQALRSFEVRKAALGQATFGDLVRQALEGLASGDLEPPRPALLLVDEYQDTSRAQDAFLGALGARRTVRVGDLKQSIYGFRGGDPGLLKEQLAAAGDRAFRLPSNFRSAAPVVELANTYVDDLWPNLDEGAGDLDGSQLAPLGGGLPVGLVKVPGSARAADLPAMAGWIAALCAPGGWDQAHGATGEPPARRSRALLLRQRTRLPVLLQRLKRAGLRPYVQAREGFWDSPGVRLLMAALEAVAHPARPLPAAALLRNLLHLKEGELLGLIKGRDQAKGLPGLGHLDPEALPEGLRGGAVWLRSLLDCGTQELAGRVLAQGALLRQLGALAVHGPLEPARARRNLGGFLSLLLEMPESPVAAFALLEDLRSGPSRGDLPAQPGEADLVIQTAHGSKGLEYDDVILPLLHARPQPFRGGTLATRRGDGSLALAWKLGQHPGPAYRELKRELAGRARRDDLNLLYVALTRARQRLCLLLQTGPEGQSLAPEAPGLAESWAEIGALLAEAHPDLLPLAEPGAPEIIPAPAPPRLEPPPPRSPLAEPEPPAGPGARARAQALEEGELVHAWLQALLVRWEDAEAFQACLDAPPEVPHAREMAERFLRDFEARGWRRLRRRTEYPIAGAAASGAQGRADLVVWEEDRIHLLDFKHSTHFGPLELEHYGQQLRRYAKALREGQGLPVEAWLVALKKGEWVGVEVEVEGGT